ncbi:hypothetical protein [Nitrosomonas ureae]|uniref:Uncharacterized protein n=1 Tax=Nitrosomonas ureae TaxID=44577 RepID=A0A1H2ER68_9PROT|nr:hypothetical protein [Nitrosomonas ureae]ALQ51856.1 hypothetical protein ATY38_11890 [Nitrosomonas ureae]SDT97610.1 hypothetical protein SAMN05216406_11495 [Nitrosomonas ureae]
MCILKWLNKRTPPTLLSNDTFKDIAYIQVLEYAAKQARGVGYNKNGEERCIGFKLENIQVDLKEIKLDWLQEILPEICTIRLNNKEIIGRPSQENDKWSEYTFVIKSDEYIKFITLESSVNANKSLIATNSSLKVAIISLWIAIITLFATITIDFFEVNYKDLMFCLVP